jgi:hypothetical protein
LYYLTIENICASFILILIQTRISRLKSKARGEILLQTVGWALPAKTNFEILSGNISFHKGTCLKNLWLGQQLLERRFDKHCAQCDASTPLVSLSSRQKRTMQCSQQYMKMFPLRCGERSSLDLKEFPCIC